MRLLHITRVNATSTIPRRKLRPVLSRPGSKQREAGIVVSLKTIYTSVALQLPHLMQPAKVSKAIS